MVWSLLKILLFVALVAAVTFAGAWLMEQRGGATIAAGGWEATLTPLQLAIGLVVLLLALWALLWLLGLLGAVVRFLNGDDNALSGRFRRRREERGLDEVTTALYALAEGDGARALKVAQAADRDLDRPELTRLLVAQAAEASGDRARAEEAWTLLARHERTRFAGLQGLMRRRIAEGDHLTALRLAERAFALDPSHRPTQDALLELQAESHDWAGARGTLAAQRRTGALPKDVHRRRDAVLAVSQAAEVVREGASVEAREAAIEANRLSPDLVPAAVLAARAYQDGGEEAKAARVLRKAWEAAPHPDLAQAFAALRPDETPEERLKRFDPLIAAQREHPETRMMAAELRLAAGDAAGARRALGPLPESAPSARALTLMAAVERAEGGDEAVVRGWLTRALSAPRGPSWVCAKCGRIHAEWVPVCTNCHAFDTLEWTVPPATATTAANGDLLPLLVEPPAAPPAMPATPDPAR